jgi:universal stress protein E
MDPIRNIVAIVDPTRKEQPAVLKAAQLAEHLDATLELFACDTNASLAARRSSHALLSPQETFVADLRPLLEKIALPLRRRGLDVGTSTVPVVDNLPTAILKHADVTANLVVKDTHHHSVARRTFLSNTDWQLIRHCSQPLLLVKSNPWSTNPCIVAAVDPGHVNDKPATLDRRILDYASIVTERLHGHLHVAHAYLPESIIAQAVAGDPPMVDVLASETLQLEEQRRRAQVMSLLEGLKIPPANLHVRISSAIELLIELAERLPADITVMGAISRSGFGRAFIGSTAEDILERLPCDALIVKTPDFGESLPF